MIEDGLAYPTMVRLAGCLDTLLKEAGIGLCFVGVVPGGTVALDYCSCGNGECGGQAWVRLISVFPSTNFPTPDAAATCATLLAYRLEVGVSQCIPTIDSRGRFPTQDDMLTATRLQMAAMQAARQAIACCMNEDQQYILENYQPMENSGACGGGFWTVVIGQEF